MHFQTTTILISLLATTALAYPEPRHHTKNGTIARRAAATGTSNGTTNASTTRSSTGTNPTSTGTSGSGTGKYPVLEPEPKAEEGATTLGVVVCEAAEKCVELTTPVISCMELSGVKSNVTTWDNHIVGAIVPEQLSCTFFDEKKCEGDVKSKEVINEGEDMVKLTVADGKAFEKKASSYKCLASV